MKKLMTEWRQFVNEQESQLNTIGDLKRALKLAIQAKRDGQGKGALKDFAVCALLDAIPGAGTAKGIFDLVRSTYKMPDEKKTNTALDFLNVDDEVSAIVDDTIENAFLKVLGQELEGESDERRLEDLDVTTLLQKYIAREFDKRTISGYGE